jgi:hypothetical protein
MNSLTPLDAIDIFSSVYRSIPNLTCLGFKMNADGRWVMSTLAIRPCKDSVLLGPELSRQATKERGACVDNRS